MEGDSTLAELTSKKRLAWLGVWWLGLPLQRARWLQKKQALWVDVRTQIHTYPYLVSIGMMHFQKAVPPQPLTGERWDRFWVPGALILGVLVGAN